MAAVAAAPRTERAPVAGGDLPQRVLDEKLIAIGASTGYGLASRIAAAFASNAATIGVFFEKPAEADRYRVEKKFFGFSLLYLFALFSALLADRGLDLLLGTAGPGGPFGWIG